MSDELVGRDEELTALRTARANGLPGIVVAAPTGLGRTCLLTAAAIEWRSRRLDVQLVRATASARQLRFAALSSIIGEQFDGPLSFDLVSDALAARAAHGHFVLVIDDLHLLDEASVRVIADAVGRHDSFILASVDEAHLGLDPLTEAHLLEVVHLGPLSVEAIGALAERRLGTAVDATSWWERCQGNPTELLDTLDAEHPDLDRRRSGAGLSSPAKRLLNVIALAEPFPLDAALDIADDDALDELSGAGIVSVGDDGAGPVVRLRHPGLAPRLRRSLGPLEARGARRAALTALRDRWPQLGATGRLRLAALAVDAGVELADDELLEATELAPSAGDATLTLRLARDAARRLGRFSDLVRLADVAHEQGEVGDLDDALTRMRAGASEPDEFAAIAVAEAQHLLWRVGDGAAAVAALEDPTVASRPEVAALRSRVLATIGRLDEARAVALPLLVHPSPRVRTQALIGTAHALRRAGRPAEAVQVLDRALTDRATVLDPVQIVGGQVLEVARAHSLTESGRWAEALTASGRALDYAQRYDEAAGRAIAALIRGVALLEAGSPSPAVVVLGDAVERFDALRQPAGVRWATSARALAAALTGDAVAAQDDLDRLDRTVLHPADLFPALEPRARAWTAVAAADPEAGRRTLRAATEHFLGREALGAAWACAHDLVSLGDPAPLLAVATRVPEGAREPLDRLRIDHATAQQRNDAVALAELVDRFEELGGLRWAAECAAAWHAASTRSGDKDGVRRAKDRLAAVVCECDGLDLPSLAAGRASALTAREREIALLAARGLTSRAIGDRLGLSVRTVDNHLARCFDKLGTRSRAELADLLAT